MRQQRPACDLSDLRSQTLLMTWRSPYSCWFSRPPETDIYCLLNITLYMIPMNPRFNHQKFAPRVNANLQASNLKSSIWLSTLELAKRRPAGIFATSPCTSLYMKWFAHLRLPQIWISILNKRSSQNFTVESVDISDIDIDACEVRLWNRPGDDTINHFTSGTSLIQRVHEKECVYIITNESLN